MGYPKTHIDLGPFLPTEAPFIQGELTKQTEFRPQQAERIEQVRYIAFQWIIRISVTPLSQLNLSCNIHSFHLS